MDGYIFVVIVIYALFGFVFYSICNSLAKEKGYINASSLGILGFFFGVIVLIYVAGLPDLHNRRTNEILDRKINEIQELIQKANCNAPNVSANTSPDNFNDLPPL